MRACILVSLLVACAPGPNVLAHSGAAETETAAGFWRGLWHGLICPITFIISLFSDGVNLYEVYNNGGWYNFGFLLGGGIDGMFLFEGGTVVVQQPQNEGRSTDEWNEEWNSD